MATRHAALYVRVSTDKQSVDNQVRELTAIAEPREWQIVECYHDAGVSGAKGRKDRPGVDQMLNDAGKGRFDVVMCGRSTALGVRWSTCSRQFNILKRAKQTIHRTTEPRYDNTNGQALISNYWSVR